MAAQKLEAAMLGIFKENLVARYMGLADKSEHTGKDGAPLQHTVLYRPTDDPEK